MKTLTLLFLCAFLAHAATDVQSLAGKWSFALDRGDIGIADRWFSRELLDKIKLPGSLPEQGIGDAPSIAMKWTGGIQEARWWENPVYAPYAKSNDFHFPFWLQPETYYVGAAWFQREFTVPKDWSGKRVVLSLERPHWETRVWVDGKLIGTNNALGTPHEFDLGPLAPGKHKHTLTIRVDNRLVVDVGHDSHSVTDHTQGNWNGIVGRIELRATPLVWIEDVQVFPNVAKRSVRVVTSATNASARMFRGKLTLSVGRNNKQVSIPVSRNFNTAEKNLTTEDKIDLGPNAPLWDEFTPDLLSLRAELRGEIENGDSGNSSLKYERVTTFGLREITTQGTQFMVNSRKTFFRGTLECAIFPKTGYPPTDVDSWKRIIRVAKAHGLNMIRFHSWCPPEAAFVAADELGFYYQVEVSSWANSSTTLGDGKPVDAWLYAEAARMLKHYGNHPSFLLMPYGNEPGGKNHARWLAEWVAHWKKTDSRRLYTSGAGWPQISENEFHVTPDPRIQAWGGGLKSRINARPPETTTDYRDYISKRSVPVISHEIGQWCVYPNFDEMKKYTGYLKPKNFEIFRDTLRRNHTGDQARGFLHASGKLQTLCYKEDIESALRTPGMGGFQLLDLHDFPGQGTALVGVLDPFWEEKGYVTPDEYRRFCNSTVPLARLAKRVFTTDETLEAGIEIAHFGAAPLKHAATTWKLVNDAKKVVASGALPAKDIPVDNSTALGQVSVGLAKLSAPARCKLVVRVDRFENDWDVWIYPPRVATNVLNDITITPELNDTALAKLNTGGKVLLLVPPGGVAPDQRLGQIALGFSSIFWNTAWTHRQPPHTLGILCEPGHPLFASFPTESHSDWQWWYLVSRAGAMILDDLPADVRPQVQVIDDWVTNRRLGLFFEAKVSGGKLAVCSIGLMNGLETNAVARQFRHSVLNYLASDRFKPKVSVTPEQVRRLYAKPSLMDRMSARISASSEQAGFEVANAIDGNPGTMWHTAYEPTRLSHPHELRLQFETPVTIRAFRITPRQDGNRNGWIKDYAIYVSDSATAAGEAVSTGTFARDDRVKTVTLPKPTTGRFIRFVALSGFDGQPYAALAEFEVL